MNFSCWRDLEVLLLVLVAIGGCARQSPEVLPRSPGKSPDTPPRAEQPPPTVIWSMVWRKSRNTDKHGGDRPPWDSAVAHASLKQPPVVGSLITVLPLRASIPPCQAPIVAITTEAAVPDLDIPAYWVAEVDLSTPAVFDAQPNPNRADEAPFDVILIHPPAPHAKLYEPSTLKGDLPLDVGCSVQTLWAAVDLEADGRADAAIFRYCCDKPDIPSTLPGPSPCELDCQKTFARDAGKPWFLAQSSQEIRPLLPIQGAALRPRIASWLGDRTFRWVGCAGVR